MQLLTKENISNRLKMSVQWVEKATSDGRIPPPIHIDGHKRWREKDIDEWIKAGCPYTAQPSSTANNVEISQGSLNLKQIEKEAILRVLKLVSGNREKAARLLGIGERTLYRKIQEYRLD